MSARKVGFVIGYPLCAAIGAGVWIFLHSAQISDLFALSSPSCTDQLRYHVRSYWIPDGVVPFLPMIGVAWWALRSSFWAILPVVALMLFQVPNLFSRVATCFEEIEITLPIFYVLWVPVAPFLIFPIVSVLVYARGLFWLFGRRGEEHFG